jgi:hypothetical protein
VERHELVGGARRRGIGRAAGRIVPVAPGVRCRGSSGGQAQTEIWNGRSWTAEAPGPPDGLFFGVACTPTGSCIAVGYFSGTNSSLAEQWDGTSWSVLPLPVLLTEPGEQSELLGVSCASGSCTAVGWAGLGGDYSPVAVRWSGTTVTSLDTTSAASSRTELYGVSCASPTTCTGVGFYDDVSLGAVHSLAETVAPNTSSLQVTHNPPGEPGSFLAGVSCASRSICIAVGFAVGSSGADATLDDWWYGGVWSNVSTPNPSGSASAELSGVSCTAMNACMAVGSASGSSGATTTLAERWNGSSWAIQPTP